jgi:Coenzyme PQQ synthesis protein D (PqqD)
MVFRKIGDETFLVPVRDNVGELDNIYVLDEVAARIWELVDGKNTLQDISDIIFSEYDAAADEIERDVTEFLEGLESIGAVKKNDRE